MSSVSLGADRCLAASLPQQSDWNVIFNFGPVCDDGYGIGYLIHSNQIHFNITSFKASHHSDTMLFGKAVEDCLLKIREVMG
jgi:hypothetical protein